MDVKALLDKQANSYPDKPAILFNDTKVTFSDLRNRCFMLANSLLQQELSPDDKIAVYLPNTPETVIAFFGIYSMGASIVPLDFMLTETEIINFINHSQACMLIMQAKKGIVISAIRSHCPRLKKIVVCGPDSEDGMRWDDLFTETTAGIPEATNAESSLSSIFYTSGSTGHPKGVMLSYAHLSCPMKTLGHYLKVSADDIFLCGGVPFSHLAGLDYILTIIYFGTTLVLTPRFQPYDFLRHIEQHKVTIFCIVPAMYVAILTLKEYDTFDLSSLRYAVVFGAPSSPALLKRFHKAYPNAVLLNGWGMTETAAPNSYSPGDINKLSSIGKLDFNIEAKIVAEGGNECAAGEEGELLLQGEAIMMGYFNEPQLTRQVIMPGGWLKTGDIVKKDNEGFYYIVGRKKDMIKVAGEIVFSPELEHVMHLHPAVKEVAVIGIADTLRGEVPKAFIVLKENHACSELELKDFLKERLAHFKIPHYFEFLKTLPKNRTGKIDKQALKKSHTSQGHQSHAKDRK